MLNINKIESDINSKNLQSTDVSRILGVKYTTTLGRREKGNWTPDDIEKFADYFGRAIAYYFDKEDNLNEATEPVLKYFNCTECIKKQKTIDDLTAERDSFRNKYIECLEELAGKKKAAG